MQLDANIPHRKETEASKIRRAYFHGCLKGAYEKPIQKNPYSEPILARAFSAGVTQVRKRIATQQDKV